MIDLFGSMNFGLLETIESYTIDEGLIKTYPIDRVINLMSDAFGLEVIEGSYKEIFKKASQMIFNSNENTTGIIAKEIDGVNVGCEALYFFVGNGEYNINYIRKHMEKY